MSVFGKMIVGIAIWFVPLAANSFNVETLYTPKAAILFQQNQMVQIGPLSVGKYALNKNETALIDLGHTEWIVDCSTENCSAESGPVALVWTAENQMSMNVGTIETARVSLKRSNRTRDFFVDDETELSEAEIHLLRTGGILIFEQDEFIVASVNFTDFDVVFRFVQWLRADQRIDPITIKSHLSYLGTIQDIANAPPNILVPFTKPQVQFAVRGQNGNPFVP